jgi:hypothetical protein
MLKTKVAPGALLAYHLMSRCPVALVIPTEALSIVVPPLSLPKTRLIPLGLTGLTMSSVFQEIYAGDELTSI